MADLFGDVPRFRPLPSPIIRKAEISDCGQYRWTLTRTWRAGPHVCFCGLNPSTADALKDDPTVIRWTRFANLWGYGGFVAVNLYPFRTPNPPALHKWADWEANGPDWYARDQILQNVDVVEREAKRAALMVACWGAGAAWNNSAEHHLDYFVECITTGDEPWPDIHCLGKTASGAPIHPMARGRHRIPDDVQPQIWRKAG